MIKHFDGWGRPILGYMEMLNYYRDDPISLRIIRTVPPIKYVVIPTTYVIVQKSDPEMFTLRWAWPGSMTSVCKNMNKTTLEALRRLYRSGDASWRLLTDDWAVTFIHRGRVCLCSWSNLYALR